jgi:penicillin amidase
LKSGGTLARAVEAFLVIAAVVVAATPLTSGSAYLALMDPTHGLLGAYKLERLLHTNLMVEGVPGTARVYWDSHGIPYIEATTDEAGMYALGWVEAGLRLFQMDVYRRLAEGRLSELVGPQAIETDKLVWAIGLPGAVRESADKMLNDASLQPMNRLIGYFLLGVNDFIRYASSHDMLPVEYRLLGLMPEPWNYTDVVAVTKTLALLYSFSYSDLVNLRLAQVNGPGILRVLGIPSRPLNPASFTCNESTSWKPSPYTPLEPASPGQPPDPAPVAELEGDALRAASRLAGGLPASTALVVEGRFTRGGRPILALDLHGSLTMPPMWMPARLRTPSIDVAGIFIPGLPFPVAGRTPEAAWGFVASRADQVDYYYYKWEGGRYYYNGTWHEPDRRTVEIRYWNPARRKMESVTVTVNGTIVGPLIEWMGSRYAVRWTGLEASEDLAFYWKASMAATVFDILSAERYLSTPALIIAAADRQGHVAAAPMGLFPVRGNLPVVDLGNGSAVVNTGFLPFNASAGEGLWEGYAARLGLPIVVDPNRPFLLVSGNRPWSGNCTAYPNGYYGYEFDDGFRFERLSQLLYRASSKPSGAGLSDVEAVLGDWIDYGLLNATRLLVALAGRSALQLGARERQALSMLSSWDGSTRRGAGTPQASLALTWTTLYYRSIMERLGVNSTEGVRLEYLISLLRSYLDGDPYTLGLLGKGYPEELAAETLREALDLLESYYKTGDMALWDYGVLHYYQPRHPLGWILPGLNLPKEPAPGGPQSPYTASSTPEVSNRTGAPVELASTARMIADLSKPYILLCLPGGVSGNPLDPHYGDLYMEWIDNEYLRVSLAENPPARGALNVTGLAGGG